MKQSSPKAKDVFRIGAYQGPTKIDSFESNAGKTHSLLADAHRQGIDFACMPECFLTGYGTPKEIRASAVSVGSGPFQDFVRRCSFGDMVSIVGFFEKRGKHLHNAAVIIHRGKLIGVHHKSIPGSPYEKEVITYASRFRVWRLRGVTFGVLVCYEGAVLEPSLLLAEQGARIIFEPHYSYISMDTVDFHWRRVRNSRTARAVENACWYVKSNITEKAMTKMGDVEGFGYGDSFILDTIGRPRAEAGFFTVGWITADVPRKELTGKRESRVKLAPRETRKQIARLYLGR